MPYATKGFLKQRVNILSRLPSKGHDPSKLNRTLQKTTSGIDWVLFHQPRFWIFPIRLYRLDIIWFENHQ